MSPYPADAFASSLPGIETLPVEGTEARLLPPYRVLLHNDDVNSMDHVMGALMQVFGFAVEKAARVMLEAHVSGVALCVVEPLERAEFHRDQLQALSLVSTIEPAE